jgi:hypothetical protein
LFKLGGGAGVESAFDLENGGVCMIYLFQEHTSSGLGL